MSGKGGVERGAAPARRRRLAPTPAFVTTAAPVDALPAGDRAASTTAACARCGGCGGMGGEERFTPQPPATAGGVALPFFPRLGCL